MPRRGTTSGLTCASVALCCAHLCILWVLGTSQASGLVWWANILLLAGPPLALLSLVAALRAPRRALLSMLNGIILAVYVAVWTPIVPRLTFW